MNDKLLKEFIHKTLNEAKHFGKFIKKRFFGLKYLNVLLTVQLLRQRSVTYFKKIKYEQPAKYKNALRMTLGVTGDSKLDR